MSLRLPKLTAFLLILVLAVPMFLAPSTRAPVASAAHTGDIATANDAVASKIHPKLQAAVAAAALTDDFDVIVYAEAGADLSRYMSNILAAKYVWPNGTQTYYGRIKAANIAKLASLPAIAAIQDLRYQGDLPQIPDMGERRLNAYDPATARATIAALQAKKGTVAPRAPAGQATVADWFDIRDVHKSKAAWDLGYTGEGVKVLVNDTGSDFSHPDLIGTIARIDDPGSPYNGWPEMFDSFSMLNLAYDYFHGTKYINSGVGIYGYAPDYADTSTTRSGGELTALGDGAFIAEFAPIHSADPAGHTYKLPRASKSGVYHFGSHPDTMLEAFYDERVAVLVVDEHTPGVYDTVYVDLDDDYDFTNNRKSVKGDEYVYMDLDVDGYPDISGGIIYWISDAAHSLPASDWLYGIGPNVAGPGDLVAFSINDISEGGGDHGTLCASGVAGQGIIDGDAPSYKPAGDGTRGTGMSVGGGRNVKLSSNGSGYTVGNALNEGVLFAALGYDGLPKTADDMQIVSDSWGDSGAVNDGWDYNSRLFDFILRFVNPYLSEGDSTGNGGSGYGTTNSPGANLSIAVGASTLYDSDGVTFDSIAGQGQILYNDSMSFSDRGPSAQGEVGVSVLANGAWGAGAIPLNEAVASGRDGWSAWENWGGTSRSTPVALGNLALAMQAFRQKNGRWPTNVEARSILMAGADTAWNDGFVEGSGVVNALRSVQIAAGIGGVNVVPDSLTFGDYRGTKYDAFTSIMYPGRSNTQTFTVRNAGVAPVNLAITDDQFVRFAEKTIAFTTVDQKLETANTRMPDYLIDIKNLIPAGTTMMEAILIQPFEEFDPNFDYNANSSWRILPTDWTDVNRDGKLYEDKNGNGAINCPVSYGIPNWSATACEIQGGEYMRFGYGYDRGTTMQQRVKMPLERKHDGVFVALQHRSKSVAVPVTHLKIQLNFYRTEDMPWLTTPAALTVPAGGTATFDATMAVPATANVGLYEATIRIDDGANVTNVPVVANVAAYSTDFLFGGPPETKTPYENGMVGGYFSWTDGTESGDWRFFFMDAPDTTPKGTYLLVDNRWSGVKNDIDTVIMGPTQDCFSNGVGCGYPISTRFPGAKPVYGPYTLAPVGGSDRLNPRAGVWFQQTSTGGPREIVSAPVKAGLNLVALHNNLFEGSRWAETFQAQVGAISAAPNPVDLFVDSRTTGTFPVTVKSSLPLPDLQVAAFGLGVPDARILSEIQDNPNDPSSASYQFRVTAKDAAYIEVNTEAAAGDIDLYLLCDTNGDGNFDFSNEVIASSTTSTGNEHVKVTFPADGNYLVAVHGWGIEPGAKFTIEMNVVQGTDLRVGSLPAGPYPPNTPISFQANWSLDAPLDVDGSAFGVVVLGPSGAESAIEIPVRLHNVIGSRETVTLTAQEDARIFSGAVTTNFGQDKHLYAGANDTSRSVMRFDLSGINPAYGIESAQLRVYVDAFGGGSQAVLAAYPLAKDFAESSVTWNTPWATTGGDFTNPPVTAPITKANVGQFIEFDVTPWVQTWFNSPGTNHGVLLRVINQTTYTCYRFASGEYWDTGKVPALIVTVTKP